MMDLKRKPEIRFKVVLLVPSKAIRYIGWQSARSSQTGRTRLALQYHNGGSYFAEGIDDSIMEKILDTLERGESIGKYLGEVFPRGSSESLSKINLAFDRCVEWRTGMKAGELEGLMLFDELTPIEPSDACLF